ncbi:MAG: hypothetical protein C5B59_17010 [Bacteroidetes bacterium]|nr:MAG: hypothetical protein C5B59_17010 [Bacteroidota bacterium]
MKKMFLLPVVLFAGLVACSQPTHPNSPHDTVQTKNIKVTYGRPYKKGRDIFGKLEPYGKVYRVGADEATTIKFDKDGTFAGKPVKAGTYTLFAIPNEDKWTIILNSQLGQWGAFDYNKYKDKDVLHADVPVKKLSSPVEQLTIRFVPSDMIIEWDKTQVSVPVNFT